MSAEVSLPVAFLIGLFSTLHCWGMCGGIIGALSMAMPQPVRRRGPRELLILSCYNFGRIGSYTVAGVLTAAIGFAFSSAAGGVRGALQVLSGLMLIIIGLRIAGWTPGTGLLERAGLRLWRRLQPLAQPFLPVDSPSKALVVGAVWGWLPCGLVYSVLLWSATSADPVRGGLYMLTFGLGTLPGMVGAGWLAGRLPAALRRPLWRRAAGTCLLLLGLAVLTTPYRSSRSGGAPTVSSSSMRIWWRGASRSSYWPDLIAQKNSSPMNATSTRETPISRKMIFTAVRYRDSLAEFSTTSSELSDIPSAAIQGSTRPDAAAGSASRL